MRPEKTAIISEVRGYLEGQDKFVVFGDYKGITVDKATSLRHSLRAASASFHIVKNTFAVKSLNELGLGDAAAFVKGPTAVITGIGDCVGIAKVIKNFVKGNGPFAVRGAILNGKVMSASDVEVLADIPPREILLGQLLGTLASPMSSIVGVLNQKVSSLLWVLKAVEEKKKENA